MGAGLAIDSRSREFQEDPYAVYRRLREAGPVIRVAVDGELRWVISHYAQAIEALRDPRFGREAAPPDKAAGLVERLTYTHSMLNRDPPEQTRLRRAAGGPFRARAIATLRRDIERRTDELLDAIEEAGEVDFVEEFAEPLTIGVLSAFVGLSERITRPAMKGRLSPRSVVNLRALLEMKFAERRKSSLETDDFLGSLLASREAKDFESDEEVIATYVVILAAGQHTTAKLLSNGLNCLLANPAQLEILRGRPELIGSAVEEMLRYESPVQATFRWTHEDVTIGDRTIPRGAEALLLIGAANRDPLQFGSPDDFDVERTNNRHLGMGAGPHLCIGAGVARLIAETAFTRLLRRFHHHLEGTPGREPRWGRELVFRGIEELPVRVIPGTAGAAPG